jgi:hypothetical protein
LYHPEYLKEGMRIIFREGRCKGIGIISKILWDEADILPLSSSTTLNNNTNNTNVQKNTLEDNTSTEKNNTNVQNSTSGSGEKIERKELSTSSSSVEPQKNKISTSTEGFFHLQRITRSEKFLFFFCYFEPSPFVFNTTDTFLLLKVT